MPIITMSRQLGSRASELANRLCDELALVAFDKGLMAKVATDVGLGQHEVVDYSEDEYEKRGFFEALCKDFGLSPTDFLQIAEGDDDPQMPHAASDTNGV